MSIVVVGVDHTTASIELRERLACSARQIPQLLQTARKVVEECVLLSTCNRVELYAICPEADQGEAALLKLLAEARHVTYDELAAHSYAFRDHNAIAHLFGVASGLHSLVPGEPQIQGQVVEALEIAQGGGFAGPLLSALFRAALGTGKRARTETAISRNAASISHVAVQLARRLFPNFSAANILLVGSGKMSELAARNLRNNGAGHLTIVNRTREHAVDLAEVLQARHRSFTELADALLDADVVISSTTSPRALITYELMYSIMERRSGRSMLVIDIALPRDVEPTVATLPGVHVYNLDDLQAEVARGIDLRLQEAVQVQAIIAEEAASFEHWQASLSVVDTISDLRQHADGLRQQELERTLRRLAPSLSEKEQAAVQEFSTRLVNKLLHIPMLRLKEAAADGQGYVYTEAMRYLFGLDDEDGKNNHRDASEQARDDTDTAGDRAPAQALAQP